jgi:hypothetical protein
MPLRNEPQGNDPTLAYRKDTDIFCGLVSGGAKSCKMEWKDGYWIGRNFEESDQGLIDVLYFFLFLY